MQQVALGDEHQRVARGQCRHGLPRAGKQLDVLAEQLGTAEGVVLVSGTSRSDEKEVEKMLGNYL